MTLLIIQLSQQYYRYVKYNSRADSDSIYKQTIKAIDFEDVTKEFLDEVIHTLINDEKYEIK